MIWWRAEKRLRYTRECSHPSQYTLNDYGSQSQAEEASRSGSQKIASLHQQLAGARQQPDDPKEVPRLEKEIAKLEDQIREINESK
ncbi:MAG: hypothetical protein R3B91_15835 [Planctomycetaceae bacterium]